MKAIQCEMCGSTEMVKKDGMFVCQSCGTKYSVEEAKKLMIEGTVDVSGSTVKVDYDDYEKKKLEKEIAKLKIEEAKMAETVPPVRILFFVLAAIMGILVFVFISTDIALASLCGFGCVVSYVCLYLVTLSLQRKKEELAKKEEELRLYK